MSGRPRRPRAAPAADAADRAAPRLVGLAPVVGREPRILILGSLPGAESLRRGQYYAHPRNGFWRVMAALAGIDPDRPYDERVARLTEAGVALWDVCAEATRPGSLDTAIRAPSANDISGFLADHASVRVVGLNGGTAARLFDKLVRPTLANLSHQPHVVALPSTSPAHARMRIEEKIDIWRRGLGDDRSGTASIPSGRI